MNNKSESYPEVESNNSYKLTSPKTSYITNAGRLGNLKDYFGASVGSFKLSEVSMEDRRELFDSMVETLSEYLFSEKAGDLTITIFDRKVAVGVGNGPLPETKTAGKKLEIGIFKHE